MKRFKWPLQRLLDVTKQREQALRATLFALSRRMAQVHQEIIRRRATIRDLLAELAAEALADRIGRQEVFLWAAAIEERRIERFIQRLESLRQQREQQAARLRRVKTSRETLERLHQEARQRYDRRVLALEQKQLDDSAGVAFVRNTRAGACAP